MSSSRIVQKQSRTSCRYWGLQKKKQERTLKKSVITTIYKLLLVSSINVGIYYKLCSLENGGKQCGLFKNARKDKDIRK